MLLVTKTKPSPLDWDKLTNLHTELCTLLHVRHVKHYKRLRLEDVEIEETPNDGDMSRIGEEANILRADAFVLQNAFVEAVERDPRYEDRKDMVQLVIENLVQECHRNATEKSRLVPLWKEVEKKKTEKEERDRFLRACAQDERLHKGVIAYHRSDLRQGILPKEQFARVDRLRRKQELETMEAEKQERKAEPKDSNKTLEPHLKDKKPMNKFLVKLGILNSDPLPRQISLAVKPKNPNFEPVRRSRLGTSIATIVTDSSQSKSPALRSIEQRNVPPVMERPELESAKTKISDTQLTTTSRQDKQPKSDSHIERARVFPSSEPSRLEAFQNQASATTVAPATASNSETNVQSLKSPGKPSRAALAVKQSNVKLAHNEPAKTDPTSTSTSYSAQNPSHSPPSPSKDQAKVAPSSQKPNIDSTERYTPNPSIATPSPNESRPIPNTPTKRTAAPESPPRQQHTHKRTRTGDAAKARQISTDGKAERDVREKLPSAAGVSSASASANLRYEVDEAGLARARSYAWR